ncbi:hypothetical protein [Moraxella lacunata]|uniref:hypothetical protein n=1 Tax=Moraxella lacunata TaxID=477 RepID=UPI003EDF75F5
MMKICQRWRDFLFKNGIVGVIYSPKFGKTIRLKICSSPKSMLNQVFRSPLYQPNTKPRLSARMLLGYTSKENTGSPLVS